MAKVKVHEVKQERSSPESTSQSATRYNFRGTRVQPITLDNADEPREPTPYGLPQDCLQELKASWEKEKRVPTLESRRVWAEARNVPVKGVNVFFASAKGNLRYQGEMVRPGTYDLNTGTSQSSKDSAQPSALARPERAKRQRARSPSPVAGRPPSSKRVRLAEEEKDNGDASGSRTRHTRAHDSSPQADCPTCFPPPPNIFVPPSASRHSKQTVLRSIKPSTSFTPPLDHILPSSDFDALPTPGPSDDEIVSLRSENPRDAPKSACTFTSSLAIGRFPPSGLSRGSNPRLSHGQGAYSHLPRPDRQPRHAESRGQSISTANQGLGRARQSTYTHTTKSTSPPRVSSTLPPRIRAKQLMTRLFQDGVISATSWPHTSDNLEPSTTSLPTDPTQPFSSASGRSPAPPLPVIAAHPGGAASIELTAPDRRSEAQFSPSTRPTELQSDSNPPRPLPLPFKDTNETPASIGASKEKTTSFKDIPGSGLPAIHPDCSSISSAAANIQTSSHLTLDPSVRTTLAPATWLTGPGISGAGDGGTSSASESSDSISSVSGQIPPANRPSEIPQEIPQPFRPFPMNPPSRPGSSEPRRPRPHRPSTEKDSDAAVSPSVPFKRSLEWACENESLRSGKARETDDDGPGTRELLEMIRRQDGSAHGREDRPAAESHVEHERPGADVEDRKELTGDGRRQLIAGASLRSAASIEEPMMVVLRRRQAELAKREINGASNADRNPPTGTLGADLKPPKPPSPPRGSEKTAEDLAPPKKRRRRAPKSKADGAPDIAGPSGEKAEGKPKAPPRRRKKPDNKDASSSAGPSRPSRPKKGKAEMLRPDELVAVKHISLDSDLEPKPFSFNEWQGLWSGPSAVFSGSAPWEDGQAGPSTAPNEGHGAGRALPYQGLDSGMGFSALPWPNGSVNISTGRGGHGMHDSAGRSHVGPTTGRADLNNGDAMSTPTAVGATQPNSAAFLPQQPPVPTPISRPMVLSGVPPSYTKPS